jgi:ferredoxin-NADP reductase
MKFTLLERRVEVPGVESFIFQPAEPVSWKAGQFFHYVLHHEPTDDRGSDRWFTISAAPFEKLPRITTRFAPEKGSTFKAALAAMKLGEAIEMGDLDGDFTLEDPAGKYVFIAGGIGITPFRSILAELDHEGKQPTITLLYANRDQNIVYKEELEAFAGRNPNFKIHYIISPERVDEAKIKALIPDHEKPVFYVSGPEPMVIALGEILKGMGVPADHVKEDQFPGYPAA